MDYGKLIVLGVVALVLAPVFVHAEMPPAPGNFGDDIAPDGVNPDGLGRPLMAPGLGGPTGGPCSNLTNDAEREECRANLRRGNGNETDRPQRFGNDTDRPRNPIAAAANELGKCARGTPEERKNCFDAARDNLMNTIRNAQDERRKLEDKNLANLRQRFKDKLQDELEKRQARFEDVLARQKREINELKERLRNKSVDKMTPEERNETRNMVNATVTGHITRLEAYLDTLESKGVNSTLIEEMRVKLNASLVAWNNATTPEARKAVIDGLNTQWREFKESIRDVLVENETRMLVAQSQEALGKAKLVIANLSATGVNTTNLEAIVANLDGKITALSSGNYTAAQVRLRAIQLNRAFVHLRIAINRAINKQEVPPMPKELEPDEAPAVPEEEAN